MAARHGPVTPTAHEQWIIERVNAARADPVAEAVRLGVTLAPGEAAPAPPLGVSGALGRAARDHSAWQVTTGSFSHTGAGGSEPHERIEAAGYPLTGSWQTGENIAWQGTTGRIHHPTFLDDLHEGLFRSPGHRANMLDAGFREIGVGEASGPFAQGSVTYSALMITEAFGRSGDARFVTGVVFGDTDGDGAYSIGEGMGAVPVAAGGATSATWASGGYSLALPPVTAQITLGPVTLAGAFGGTNAKVDLVDGAVHTTFGVTLVSGAETLVHTGLYGGASSGNGAANRLIGGGGDDTLDGAGGDDTLTGGAGDDRLIGGPGRDTVLFDAPRAAVTLSDTGGALSARAPGNGTDTLIGVERLEFEDGAWLTEFDNPTAADAYRLYGGAFGRTPDEAGLRYWVGVLESGGIDRREVAQAFVDGPEFARLFGPAPSDPGFVTALYENVLGRAPDGPGLAFWTGAFASGTQTKADMLISFADSPENTGRTAPDLAFGAWVEDPLAG